MSRTLLAVALSAIATSAAAQTPSRVHVVDASDMLESVLPAIVTVAVNTGETETRVFGFGSGGDTRVPVRNAYRRGLDLSFYNGSGSGFVVAYGDQKYVVTNSHVIDQALPDEIFVFSTSRSRYRMKVIGADSYRDVAVLGFVDPAGTELGTVEIHDEDDLRIGAPVFAIGNPLGQFPYTITSGVISGLNRTLDGLTANVGYVQTDATLIWGNSGGPLIGADGTVVGLNSRIHLIPQLEYFPAPQINFSLEGRHLARIVDDLVRVGRVERVWLGMVLRQGWTAGAGERTPITIDTVLDGPAATYGVRGAELISIDGEEVETLADVTAALEPLAPGTVVRLGVLRDGAKHDVSISAGTLGNEQLATIGEYVGREWFGLTLVEERGSGSPVLRVFDVPGGAEADLVGFDVTDAYPEELPDTLSTLRAGDRIVFAGYYGENAMLWRVSSLRELGIITRIVAPGGSFSLGATHGERARVVDAALPLTLIY